MIDLSYRPMRYSDRWFAYLDLLGFTELVQSGSIEEVLPIYEDALNRMRSACKLGKSEVGLINSWFSDTFIIYSKSDDLKSFAHLESAARIFFQQLVLNRIPVRGCITHGKLYSQSRLNIFIGPALIEAHTYGEALDWIGLCLSPSLEKKLSHDLPLSRRPFYRKVTQRSILRKAPADHLYAFAFNNAQLNGRNPYEEALRAMEQGSPSFARIKYQNALGFLAGAANNSFKPKPLRGSA